MILKIGTEIEIPRKGEASCEYCDPQDLLCESCSGTEIYCESYCPDRIDFRELCPQNCDNCSYFDQENHICRLCMSNYCMGSKDTPCWDCMALNPDALCARYPICRDEGDICEACRADGRPLVDFCDNCDDRYSSYRGREIENIYDITEDVASLISDIYWDESVGPEIVSVPMSPTNLKRFHKKVVEELKREGYHIAPERNAGGHITISLNEDGKMVDLDETGISQTIFAICSRFLPVLLINSCERRTAWRGKRYRNFFGEPVYQKYIAVRRRTSELIEFRYPDGTMSEEIFNRTVDLIVSIVSFSIANPHYPSPSRKSIDISRRLSLKIMTNYDAFEEVQQSQLYDCLRSKLSRLLAPYNPPTLI